MNESLAHPLQRSRWGMFLMALAGLIQLGCVGESLPEPADLVLTNAKVITMDPGRPQAEAVAVRGNTIVVVGSRAEVQAFVGETTRVVDLAGQLVVPGLIDGHGHFLSLGESLMGIDLKPARSWDEIVAMVAEAVEQADPGEWIVGRGWHQDKWEQAPAPQVEGLPTHQGLSDISPDNPVMLIHVSGHGVFVNQRALVHCGITRDTTDPAGGEIVRGPTGNPTGMLREAAQDVARDALAAYRARRPAEAIEEEFRLQVKLAADEAISNGITTFHDMGETFETIDSLKRMADERALPLRLYVAIEEPAEELEGRLAEYRMIGHGNGFLTVRMIGEKVLDGALGVHGGWLLEPYTDHPRSSGFNVVPVEDIRRSAELAVKYGYQMAIQGIGDRASRELLDIYEHEFEANPDHNDLRWRIEHCQVIHPNDLTRFAELGVIASVRGVFATSDGSWVEKRLGPERTRERGYQYKSLVNSGATVTNGTDPPVEDIDPIANFHATVARRLADGSIFLPEQRLTRDEALRTYTINNAYAAFEENTKGSLTPGKLADITVLSRDILTIPEDEILQTRVSYTIIDGKIAYQGAE